MECPRVERSRETTAAGQRLREYHLDSTCLQETKVAVTEDLELASGHKLVLIQQRTAKYRGLGFINAP